MAAPKPAAGGKPVQPEEEKLIRLRLLIGSTTLRGEPRMLRLAHAYARFCQAVEGGTLEQAEEEHRAVQQEICVCEQLAKKQRVARGAVRGERAFLEAERAAAGAAAARTRAEIEEAREELRRARVQRRQAEECEVVRRDVAGVAARAASAAEGARIAAELQRLAAERERLEAVLQVRRKQFGAVLHAIQDLRSTLEEEGEAAA